MQFLNLKSSWGDCPISSSERVHSTCEFLPHLPLPWLTSKHHIHLQIPTCALQWIFPWHLFKQSQLMVLRPSNRKIFSLQKPKQKEQNIIFFINIFSDTCKEHWQMVSNKMMSREENTELPKWQKLYAHRHNIEGDLSSALVCDTDNWFFKSLSLSSFIAGHPCKATKSWISQRKVTSPQFFKKSL